MTVDTYGREVTIEEAPERVMTHGPEAPTPAWAAGATDRIDVLVTVGEPLGPAEAAFEGVPEVSPDESPSKEVLLEQ